MNEVYLPIVIGAAASIATLIGGCLALQFADRIGLLLGLSAGIVLGIAIFDLVPEALSLGAETYHPRYIFAGVALGAGVYMLVDRVLASAGEKRSGIRAQIGPASLTLHSLFDGIGVGLAFQMSTEIGWIVALGVLTHDLADGVNTVGLSLANGRRDMARRWLLINGIAPFIGVCIGQLIDVPTVVLAPVLAAFAGIFLYIGAGQLIPRSVRLSPRRHASVAIIAGFALIFSVAR